MKLLQVDGIVGLVKRRVRKVAAVLGRLLQWRPN